MQNTFKGKAISRQDGSDQDGIHLLWTAPNQAGYSVDGYDIQRRDAQSYVEESCYGLTENDFNILQTEFRLDFPFGKIGLQQSKCPQFPKTPPDEPYKRIPNKVCIDFQSSPKTSFPNPRIEKGVQFLAYDQPKHYLSKRYFPTKKTKFNRIGDFIGYQGTRQSKIVLDKPTNKISLQIIFFKELGKLSVFDKSGKQLDAPPLPKKIGKVIQYQFSHENIQRVEINATEEQWLLLEFCYYTDTPRRCVDFSNAQTGKYPNPYTHQSFQLTAYESKKKAAEYAVITKKKKTIGLDCSKLLSIELSAPTTKLSLKLAQFEKIPKIELFNTKGKLLEGFKPDICLGEAEEIEISSRSKIAKILIHSVAGSPTILQSICLGEETKKRNSKRGKPSVFPQLQNANNSFANPKALLAAAQQVVGKQHCLLYTIDFKRQHRLVRVQAGFGSYLGIAFSDGKAVEVRMLQSGSNPAEFLFENRFVDRVKLYTNSAIRSLTICVDVEMIQGSDWSNAPYIARGIQLPFKNFNPNLISDNDEENLAFNRLVGGESLELPSFKDLAETMNTAGNDPDRVSPLEFHIRTKDRMEDPPVDLHVWPYGLSTTMDPVWRRVLGFGYFDDGTGLNAGQGYDYKITGYFRRRDIEEELLSFKTVPEGTLLPSNFKLGALDCFTRTRTAVKYFPEILDTQLRGTARKGINIQGTSPFDKSLVLKFPQPITRIVLEIEPGLSQNFRYEAKETSFIPGIGAFFADPIPNEDRVLLEFTDPIDELSFYGTGFLYGVRLNPVGDFNAANALVPISVILPNVVYQPSAEPTAPVFLGTQNLQQAAIVGNPQDVIENPPNDMGFQLKWLPPPSGSSTPVPWPEDLDAFPPFDMLGFHLERARVDGDNVFKPIEDQDTRTLFMGSREGKHDPPQLSYGIDLLEVFPLNQNPRPPISVFMEAQDVLHNSSKKLGVPGALYQYRIFSVDVIGRRSSVPTLGSVVRLEKRIAPPQPSSPSQASAAHISPSGVRAFILQSSDPNLSVTDKALLGANSNLVVLEWGWSEAQRNTDPFATEFRVYWQSILPDQVKGVLVGAASLSGGLYSMQANLDQSIDADLYTGKYIKAGNYPFKIHSHTAGQNITFKLEPSALEPSLVPQSGAFVLNNSLDGKELRPNRWQEREVVIPITPAENYRHVFPNRLNLTSTQSRVKVWVGVSAADDQYYIPDELSPLDNNGGREGNESSIAPASAQARYIGRPNFVVPPPLADVPEIVSREPVSTQVEQPIDIPALFGANLTIPPGHKVLVEYISSTNLLHMIGTNGGQIKATLPDGTSSNYTLANPTDQADFLAQINAGTPSAIEGKFIMDFLIRFKSSLQNMWSRVYPNAINYATIKQLLPADPERYFYQVRLVDQAGHFSENGAIVPSIVRVKSTRVPKGPRFEMNNSQTDILQIKTNFRDQFDLKWLILFAHTQDLLSPLDETTLEKAQLLRIPDRMDLYPDHGIRIRLKNGTVIAPVHTQEVSTGTLEDGIRTMVVNLDIDYNEKAAVWAVLMTRDGIASKFVGPIVATTGPEPLVIPNLVYSRLGRKDQFTWGALAVPAEVSIERSYDAGTTWERVSPWLVDGVNSYAIEAPLVNRRYRLQLKGRRGQTATGAAFIINNP